MGLSFSCRVVATWECFSSSLFRACLFASFPCFVGVPLLLVGCRLRAIFSLPVFACWVFAARGSHILVCPLFFSANPRCRRTATFHQFLQEIMWFLEFVLRILLRHADVAVRCANSQCGTLTAVVESCFCASGFNVSAPIASSWFVMLWRDKVF